MYIYIVSNIEGDVDISQLKHSVSDTHETFLPMRRYASAVFAVMSVRPSVSPSVRLSQFGALLRRLNLESRKQRLTIA